MKTTFCILAALILSSTAFTQEKFSIHHPYFGVGFTQIKESANFGLVFNGPDINFGYNWTFGTNNRFFNIESEIGVCIPFSKSIPALSFYLKPVELSYIFDFGSNGNQFCVGPLIKAEYSYTLYPQLQSAFDYWFTNFSFGAQTESKFQISEMPFKARLKFSVLGFTSRQANYRNPYFYDIGFKFAIQHLNSDLQFSGPGKYNTTSFELDWKPKPESRIMLSYTFDYLGYFENPKISIISQNIKIAFNIKNKTI